MRNLRERGRRALLMLFPLCPNDVGWANLPVSRLFSSIDIDAVKAMEQGSLLVYAGR